MQIHFSIASNSVKTSLQKIARHCKRAIFDVLHGCEYTSVPYFTLKIFVKIEVINKILENVCEAVKNFETLLQRILVENFTEILKLSSIFSSTVSKKFWCYYTGIIPEIYESKDFTKTKNNRGKQETNWQLNKIFVN